MAAAAAAERRVGSKVSRFFGCHLHGMLRLLLESRIRSLDVIVHVVQQVLRINTNQHRQSSDGMKTCALVEA